MSKVWRRVCTRMIDLVVDWCSYQAAKHSVKMWHYSRSMPTPPVVKMGVWEDSRFVGVILFSRGSSNNLGRPYGLRITEVCELTRIALSKHSAPVSQMLSLAISKLKRKEHGLRLIVSFADPGEGHHGGIYQASNWIYTGQSADDSKFRDATGRIWHSRQVSKSGYKKQYGEYRSVPKIDDCTRVRTAGKHRYLYPLDRAMRRQIMSLERPYPTRGSSVHGDTLNTNSEGPVQARGAA